MGVRDLRSGECDALATGRRSGSAETPRLAGGGAEKRAGGGAEARPGMGARWGGRDQGVGLQSLLSVGCASFVVCGVAQSRT